MKLNFGFMIAVISMQKLKDFQKVKLIITGVLHQMMGVLNGLPKPHLLKLAIKFLMSLENLLLILT